MAEDGAIIAAGLVAKCTGQPTFSEPVLPTMIWFSCRVIQSPAASLAKSASIAAFCRRLANLKRLMSRLFSRGRQQPKPLLEGKRGNIGFATLLFERLCHTRKAERNEADLALDA